MEEEYELNLCNGKVVNLKEEIEKREKELKRHIFNTPFEPFFDELNSILDGGYSAKNKNKEEYTLTEFAIEKAENLFNIIKAKEKEYLLFCIEINGYIKVPKEVVLHSLWDDFKKYGLNVNSIYITKENSLYYLNKWKEIRDVKLFIASYMTKGMNEEKIILNNNDEFLKQIPFTIDEKMCDEFVGNSIEVEFEFNEENILHFLEYYHIHQNTTKVFTTDKGATNWVISLIISLMEENNIEKKMKNYLTIYKCLDSYGYIEDEQKQIWEKQGKNDNAQKSYIKSAFDRIGKKGIKFK